MHFNHSDRKECTENSAAKMDKLLRLCGLCASSVISVVKLLDFSYTEVFGKTRLKQKIIRTGNINCTFAALQHIILSP